VENYTLNTNGDGSVRVRHNEHGGVDRLRPVALRSPSNRQLRRPKHDERLIAELRAEDERKRHPGAIRVNPPVRVRALVAAIVRVELISNNVNPPRFPGF